MTSEKGDFPITLDPVDPLGEQNAGRWDANTAAQHYLTGGHDYAFDQAENRGNPQYNAPSGPAPSAPPQYPIDGASDSTSGHVYVYDQAAEGGNPQFTNNPPRGNTTSAPPPYPGWKTPTPAGGNVYSYDQPGMQTDLSFAVVQQPGTETTQRNEDFDSYRILYGTSIFVTIFCFFPVGIFAINFARRARIAARVGLTDDAKENARTARNVIVAAVIVGATLWVLIPVIHLLVTN